MSSDSDPIDKLVASVLDGQTVDWAGAESNATDEKEHLSLAALQDVSRIAQFNRELQRSGHARASARETAASGVDSSSLFRWGHLEVHELVGRGSYGEVYRATDTHLERQVALKLRRVEAAGQSDDSRFLVEARDLARVRHPNVIVVYGADVHDEQIGFWTDLIQGQTLAAHLEDQGPLGEEEIILIGLDLCRALSAVHAAGLVHGDVKATNAMIEKGGRIVLMDFGAARPWGKSGSDGRVFGSPLTMAPEILAGAAPTPAADLYSLGALLYQLASGRPPFTAQSLAELRTSHQEGSRPQLSELRPDLTAAFVAVIEHALDGDPERRYRTAAEMESALEAAKAPPAVKRFSLPAETDLLIGREAELAELERTIEGGSRLVTLLGPAGMGKTRLAVHHGWRVLDRWSGGVWFCDLSEARHLDGIAAAVAGSLAVPLGRDDAVELLGRAIAGRGPCLVVLDNFEQVVDLAGVTVGRWLELAAAAHFIVTSRERLKVRGEVVQVVEPMPVESGIGLFAERARQVDPGREFSGAAVESVRELVGLVDGLPLAIELAAARITVMTPAEIVVRMRDRFRVLGGGRTPRGSDRGAGKRHATLQAAIDGSWELLEPWEQAAFAQCSVFQGGFTLAAAENVLDLTAWPGAPWVVDVVQALVDKSLLRAWSPAAGGGARNGEARIGMYLSLQEYARGRLRELGAKAEDLAETRHGRWYARYGTDEAIAALERRGGIERGRRLEMEMENLVAACQRAVRRGDAETAVAALRAASSVFGRRGPHATAVALAKEVVAMPLASRDQVMALGCLSRAQRVSGDPDGALASVEAALATSRDIGDRHSEGEALGNLAGLLQQMGRMDEARAHFETAILIHREVGDRLDESIGLHGLGVQHLLQGRMAEARSCLESAVAIAREIGGRGRGAISLGSLAIVAAEQGRMDEARKLYEEALAINRETGDREGESNDLNNLANLLSDQGFLAEARAHYETSLTICREIGDRRLEGIVLGNLGTIEQEEGRSAEARARFEAALAIAREMSSRRSEGYALGHLGLLCREEGRREESRMHFDAALAIARELSNPRMEGITLSGLASLLGDEGRFEEARAAFARGEEALLEVGEQTALGSLHCSRAEMERRAGDSAAASTALRRAEALATEVGATPGSQLRRKLALLADGAP
jgi:predicted ATPase